MKFDLLSDIGNVRKLNEDFCSGQIITVNEKEIGIFMIADGMGGHNKGEVASKLAVENAMYYIKNNISKLASYKDINIKYLLRDAYRYTNNIVYRKSVSKDEYSGMGTTLTCALIIDKSLHIANVGDSRCYVMQNQNLTRITKDNSYVEELIQKGIISEMESLKHPKRNYITRAVGTDEVIKIDFYNQSISNGDKIILTTDGLTNSVSKEDMMKILNEQKDIKKSCNDLIYLAKYNGGNDNISIICIHFN